MAKYNTLLDVAFSVDHDLEDPHQLVEDPKNLHLVFAAMQARLDDLKKSRPLASAGEAFGICDTYEHDQFRKESS